MLSTEGEVVVSCAVHLQTSSEVSMLIQQYSKQMLGLWCSF